MKLTPITNPVALRLDTTVGTRIFAGNTMIHGDTGWRDITSLLRVPPTQGSIHIRRTQEGTTIRVLDLLYAELPDLHVLDLPIGYRPAFATAAIIVTGPDFWNAWANGRLYAFGMEAGVSVRGQATYTSTPAWPATIPGLPA